jgi:hypothetical protein
MQGYPPAPNSITKKIIKMSWSTIYIHGKAGFKEALEVELQDTWMRGANDTGHDLVMYWLREDASLRDFKLAIGSKIIFKYRLHFFSTVDEYLQLKNKNLNTGLSPQENQMVRKMVNWQRKGRQENRFSFPMPGKKQKV